MSGRCATTHVQLVSPFLGEVFFPWDIPAVPLGIGLLKKAK